MRQFWNRIQQPRGSHRSDLWAIALPILIVDVANPVLLAAVILGLTTARPFGMSIAVLVGHTNSYLLAGLLIVFGLTELLAPLFAPLIDWFLNPVPADYLLGLVLGLLLVAVAWRWKVSPPGPSEKLQDQPRESIGAALAFGAVINFAGIPFALPYFAFINELYKLDSDQKIIPLIIYNLLYALPFLLLPMAKALCGASILPALQRINRWVESASAYILPAIIGLLGLAMIVDALLFFTTGAGLV
ncbi:GAP family protein [Sedimentitalea sp. HM32M-2]|uniref:GAP family protein n=1 Tax=Sedimentitalea sp. HM32M-2 TaxID=3351566 RepID=UPI00362863BB